MLILFANVIATDMKISFKDMSYTFLGICYIQYLYHFNINRCNAKWKNFNWLIY